MFKKDLVVLASHPCFVVNSGRRPCLSGRERRVSATLSSSISLTESERETRSELDEGPVPSTNQEIMTQSVTDLERVIRRIEMNHGQIILLKHLYETDRWVKRE